MCTCTRVCVCVCVCVCVHMKDHCIKASDPSQAHFVVDATRLQLSKQQANMHSMMALSMLFMHGLREGTQ